MAKRKKKAKKGQCLKWAKKTTRGKRRCLKRRKR